MIIPLAFYPKQLLFFLEHQPFKFIVDTPALIFNESYTIHDSIRQLIMQVIWIVVLLFITNLVYQKVENKIEINGGQELNCLLLNILFY